MLNGKTGSRAIPLINSLPYLKDWLDDHPQKNPDAFLFPSLANTSFGEQLNSDAINHIYQRLHESFFQKLLENPSVPEEDKEKIRELLRKPWNPYIRRHSALTEKSKISTSRVMNQHAGWSPISNMPQKYTHYFGNESNTSLLQAYGIVTAGQDTDVLQAKQCPQCNEPNKPDSKFCAKCRMVLTYDAYTETLEVEKNKDEQLERLKTDMAQMKEYFNLELKLQIEPNNVGAEYSPAVLISMVAARTWNLSLSNNAQYFRQLTQLAIYTNFC